MTSVWCHVCDQLCFYKIKQLNAYPLRLVSLSFLPGVLKGSVSILFLETMINNELAMFIACYGVKILDTIDIDCNNQTFYSKGQLLLLLQKKKSGLKH